ncbi:MAG: hypothetical protein ABIK73_07460 [candidate division WOR-3 bacterium]
MAERKPLVIGNNVIEELSALDTIPQENVPSGIPPAKISQSGATTGQVLKWNGTVWEPANDEIGGISDGDKGDITVSNNGSTWTIDPGAVTNSKLRNSAGLSVIGRSVNTTGPVSDITAVTDGHVLRRSGTTLGFGQVATTGIVDGAVTDAKLRSSAGLSVIGRSVNTTGTVSDITAGTDGHVLRRSGTTLGFGQVSTAGIADGAVTGDKIAQSGATTGQVLKWDGTTWAPANDETGSVSDGDKGDITVSNSGNTWTIDAGAVTDTKLRNSAGLSVIGRAADTAGVVADITAATDGHVLRRSGTTLGFGQVSTAGIADGAVTGDKIAQSGATNGQVLKWNGTTWAPANDEAGATNFLALTDTPSSYSSNANKFLAVNAAEDAVIFVDPPSGASPSVITPSQITGHVNDYAPTGWASATLVRLSSNGFYRISGFAAGNSGEIKTLCNVGNNCLYLAPQHTGSVPANRIDYQEEVILWPGSSCQIFYDNVSSKWRPLTSPSSGYFVPYRSKWHDVSAERISTAVAMDQQWDYWGSITPQEAAPSSQYRYNAWNFNTGSTSSGGSGLMLVHDRTTGSVWAGSAHIVFKTHIVMPSVLSDATNHYYYFMRLAASPYSGFYDQSNTVGIYYRHTVNAGKWFLRSRNASGNETNLDSGVTVAANAEYELQISLNADCSEATFWINGVVVGRITTNLPNNVGLGWSQQLEKVSGTTARELRVYRMTAAAISA